MAERGWLKGNAVQTKDRRGSAATRKLAFGGLGEFDARTLYEHNEDGVT